MTTVIGVEVEVEGYEPFHATLMVLGGDEPYLKGEAPGIPDGGPCEARLTAVQYPVVWTTVRNGRLEPLCPDA